MYKQLGIYMAMLVSLSRGIHEPDWQPVIHHDYYDGNSKPYSLSSIVAQGYQQSSSSSFHNGAAAAGDQCEVYKVGFKQDLYFQYIHYKTEIPEMKEFTLCFWTKFTNHSNDHPIFSYAVEGQPKAILSWISNTERSSYFSLSVEGHTFYRLNYPLRLNKWYHTCQSWNGKTGEWQIWVNAERVGRGFHNRLVGHSIHPGGLAITGQEQTQLGGGFLEGDYAPRGAGGMLGEITMLQLYNVALTAGKAHRDHKHHHAHQYDHNGNQITTPAPTTTSPRATLPTHPLLTSGQINPSVMLNFAGAQPGQPPQPQVVPGQNFNAQYVNGQFSNSFVTQQLAGGRGPQQFQGQQQPQQQQLQFLGGGQQFLGTPNSQQFLGTPNGAQTFANQPPLNGFGSNSPLINSGLVHPSLVNPANVQFVNTQLETHQLFKRHHDKDVVQSEGVVSVKPKFGDKIVRKRQTAASTNENIGKQKKRELFLSDGTLLDSGLLSNSFDQSIIDGLATIGQNQPIIQQQRKEEEREPAEAEVKAVMNICTGCDEEPFGKALVFGWRTVPKKLYSGAFYTPAVPQCKVF